MTARITFVLVVVAAGIAGYLISEISHNTHPIAEEWPDDEMTVSCYKWVENDTAHVTCPDRVWSPDEAVNITVRGCEEYEYANDEPHPCPPYRSES